MEVFVRDIPLAILDDALYVFLPSCWCASLGGCIAHSSSEHAVRKQLLGLPGGSTNFQASLFKNAVSCHLCGSALWLWLTCLDRQHGRTRGIATILVSSSHTHPWTSYL